MNFKGGALIIGSLLWEKSPKKDKWKKLCLEPLANKIPCKIRIRYGRESSSRKNTFTIVVSNHPKNEFGSAFILPFKEIVKNARHLEGQAFAMAGAEGLWNKNGPSLNKNWGTVGLLVNPNLPNSRNLDIIKERWAKIYEGYNFNNSDYTIDNEPEIIDKNGFLKLEWTDEMKAFDFLLATVTVPKPKSFISEQVIAERIKETGYDEYFLNNHKNGIRTFQDDDIIIKLFKLS